MIKAKAYAAQSASAPLQPFSFDRRDPKPDDVVIEIAYAGICHSDIHTARSEWGPTAYPCVPGHEIVGKVIAVGKKVKKFKIGDIAGVGCFVDSCGKCPNCKSHEEQFCQKHTAFTYNSTELDKKTPTYGGYSTHIVVKDKHEAGHIHMGSGIQSQPPHPLGSLVAEPGRDRSMRRLMERQGEKEGDEPSDENPRFGEEEGQHIAKDSRLA
jgi:D-arabinose 1-dehydrogenase-like Zn-dependent alcohol dehydrogenase